MARTRPRHRRQVRYPIIGAAPTGALLAVVLILLAAIVAIAITLL